MKISIEKVTIHLIKVYEDLHEMGYEIGNRIDILKNKEYKKFNEEECKKFVTDILISEMNFLDELMFVHLSEEDIEIIHDDYILISEYYKKIISGEVNYVK